MLVTVAITSITTITMVAWGGAATDLGSRYVPPAREPGATSAGARLYQTKGCVQCHSIDGSPKVGPSFKGTFGTEVALKNGRIVIDEQYLRESILLPGAKLRAGYQQVMPSFDGLLREHEIAALVTYIQSLRHPATR